MDVVTLKNNGIKELVDNLFSGAAAERDKAFAELCFFIGDEDIDNIFVTLLARGDTESIYWLVRYLVAIEHPYGFEKLFSLVTGEKPLAKEQALYGLGKINEESKISFFAKVLAFDDPRDVRFAAKKLADTANIKATFPLLKALERWAGEEETGVVIIRALSRVNDPRAGSQLSRIASEKKGKVQEEAFLALSALAFRISYFEIKKYLSSANPKVREIAYFVLLRQGKLFSEKVIADALKKEGEATKTYILSNIKNIRTEELFKSVIDLMGHGSGQTVTTMARSAVKRVRSNKTLKWLISLEKRASGPEKAYILKFLSEFNDNEKVAGILYGHYRQGTDMRLKLTAIECLGRIKTEQTVQFLTNIIGENDVFSLEAAISLTHMADRNNFAIILKILSWDPAKYTVPIQVLLRMIMKMPETFVFPADIIERIFKLTDDGDDGVKYLAVRCLAKIKIEGRIENLLAVAAREGATVIKNSAIRSIREIMQKDPEEQMTMLLTCVGGTCKYFMLYRIMSEMETGPENFIDVVKTLLGFICGTGLGKPKSVGLKQARFMSILRKQIDKNKMLSMDLLRYVAMSDDEEWIFMRTINSVGICHYPGLDASFMAEKYTQASADTKIEYLRFFAFLPVPGERTEELVFGALTRENDEKILKALRETVSAWLAGAGI
ncbi:MAG: HEAT repeat domain-containing protein [Candidatus Omnitrophica bacterium]|nr:HEAT repeat domain-containing protein [Candidatus Omnitrophota bacterium]